MSQQLEQRLRSLEATLLVNPRDAWTHTRIGHVLLQLGKLDDALGYFTKVIALDPSLPEGPQGQGEVHAARKDWPNADSAYQRALSLDARHVPTLSSLIRLHEELGEHRQATPYFGRILQAKPEDVTWQRRAAFHYYQLGNFIDALVLFAKLDKAPSQDIEVTEAHGVCLSARLLWSETATVLAPIGALPQASPKAIVTLARAYEQLTDFAASLPLWHRLRQLDSSDRDAALGQARCHVELSQWRLALDILSTAPSSPQSSGEAHWLESRAHLGLGDASSAARVAQAGLPLDPPTEPRLQLVAGEALTRLTRFTEAVSHLEKAVRYKPDLLSAWLLLGEAQCGQDRFDAAGRAYEQASTIAPGDLATQLAQAHFEQQHGTLPRAKEAYIRAAGCDLRNPKAPLGAAQCAFKLGDLEATRTWLTRTLAIDPALPDAMRLNGLVNLQLDNLMPALSALQAASAFYPNDPELWATIAECYHRQGNDRLECESLERSYAIARPPATGLRLGSICRKLRTYERAVEVLTDALAQKPEDARISLELGLSLEHLERFAEARVALDATCRLLPSSAESHFALGRVCIGLEDLPAALTALEHSVRIDPTPRAVQTALGHTYHKLGLLREASQVFRNLQQSDANDVELLHALGHVLADAADNEAATHYLERAIALAPQHAATLSLLGQLALRLDRAEKAQDWFRKALNLLPDSVEVLRGLTDASARNNNHEEAIRAARQLLRIQANDLPTLSQLAESLELVSNDVEAVAAWTRAIAEGPQDPRLQLRRGLARARLGHFADAATDLSAALEHGVGRATEWDVLADCQLHQGLPVAAAEALDCATSLEPGEARRWHRLGLLELSLGHEPKALLCVARAFALGICDTETRQVLARLHRSFAERGLLAGDFQVVLDSASAALALTPDAPELLFLQGRAFGQLGLELEAITALEAAEERGHRTAECHLLLASLAEKKAQLELAERNYRAYLQLAPENHEAWCGLIRTLQQEGKTQETIVALFSAVALRPTHSEHQLLLGTLLYAERRFAEALIPLEQAAQFRRLDGATLHALAICEFAQSLDERGIASMRVALELEPSRLDWANELVAVLRKQQRYNEVVETLQPLWRDGNLGPSETETYALSLIACSRHEDAIAPLLRAFEATQREDLELVLLESYWLLHRANDVVSCAESVLQKAPGQLRALELAAKALAQSETPSDVERAITRFEQLLAAAPDQPEPKLELVRLRKLRSERLTGTTAEGILDDLSRALELAPNDPDLLFRLARCLHGLGRIEQAYDNLRRCLIVDPQRLEACLFKAELDVESRRWDEAKTAYERALVLAPGDSRALLGIADAWLALNQPTVAIPYLEQLCTLEPREERHRLRLMRLHLELENKSAALPHLVALADVRPLSNDELRQLSFMEAELGVAADATVHFLQLLARTPSDVDAMQHLAICLTQLERDEEAIPWLERLLRIAPDHSGTHRLLGLALSRQLRHEPAVSALANARSRGNADIDVLKAHAKGLRALGRTHECLEVFEQLSKLEPDAVGHWEAMGELSLSLGADQRAIVQLQRAVQLGSSNDLIDQLFDLLLEQASQSRNRGEPQQAIAHLLDASGYTREDPNRLLVCARQLRQSGALEDATALAQRAKTTSDNLEVNLLLGALWLARSVPSEATVCFEHALSLRLDSAPALAGLGEAQLRLGNLTESESALNRAKHLTPDDSTISSLLAEVAARMGKSEAAIAALRHVVRADPSRQSERLKLASLLAQQGDFAGCIDILREHGGPGRGDEDAATLLALAYESTGRWLEALALADEVLPLVPRHHRWQAHRGNALEHLGRNGAAAEAFELALELSPDQTEYLQRLGALYEQLGNEYLSAGDAKEAARLFEQALLRGNCAAHVRHQGAIAQRVAGELHRARELAEQAAQQEATYKHWLLLGQLETDLGRFDFARVAFEGALGQQSGADAWAGLSQALRHLGRIEDAIAAAREAVNLDADSERISTLARLLSGTGQVAALVATLTQLEPFRPLTLAEKLEQARGHLALGAHSESLASFEDAVDLAPSDPLLLTEFGELLRSCGQFDRAANVLAKALRLNPQNHMAGEGLARAYFETQKYELAIVAAEQALAQGGAQSLLELIAKSQSAVGRHADAARALELFAAHGEQTPATMLELGRAHAKTGAIELAIAALARAHSTSSGEFGTDELIGLLLESLADAMATGRKDKAIELIEQAREVAHQQPSVLVELARRLSELGQYERALATLAPTSRDVEQPISRLLFKAELHVRLQQWEQALEAYDRVSAVSVDDLDALIGTGRCRLELGRPVEAIAPLVRAILLRPADDTLVAPLLTALAQGVESADRRQALRTVLGCRPRDSLVRLALAHSELDLQHHATVVEVLNVPPAEFTASYESWLLLAGAHDCLGHASECQAACVEALKLKPDDEEATRLLGLSQARAGMTDEAVSALESAYLARPNAAIADQLYQLLKSQAERAETVNDLTRATAATAKALSYRKDDRKLRRHLARLQTLQGRPSEAIDTLRESITETAEDLDSWVLLGERAFDVDRPDLAAGAFAIAHRLAPANAQLAASLGIALARQGRSTEALAELEPLARTEHPSRGVLEELAALNLKLGNELAAYEYLEQLSQDHALQPGQQRSLGLFFAKSKRHEPAYCALHPLFSEDSTDFGLCAVLGQIANTLGKQKDALAALTNAHRLKPEHTGTSLLLGEVLLRAGRPQEAQVAIDRAIALGSTGAAAYDLAAACSLQLGDRDRWIQSLRAKARVCSGESAAHAALADALFGHGSYGEAKEALQNALNIEKTPELYRKFAQCCSALKDKTGCISALATVTTLLPEDANAFADYGMARFDAGHLEAAHDALSRALELSPQLATAWGPFRDLTTKLAREALQRNEAGEALRYYRILAEMPDCPFEVLMEHASCASRLGNQQLAVGSLGRALRLKPGNEQASLLCASLLIQNGRHAEAAAVYDTALASNPGSTAVAQALALLHEERGAFDLAAQALGKAYCTGQTDTGYVMSYVSALSRAGRTEDAIQTCQQAASRSPNSPEYLQRLGLLLAEQRRYAESISVLKQSVLIEPSHPSRFYLLAKVLLDVNQDLEAADWVTNGLQRHPGDPSLFHLLMTCAQRAEAQKDFLRSVLLHRQLLSSGANHAVVFRGLANALVMTGKSSEAEPLYAHAVQLEPENPQLRFELGSLYAMSRRFKEATTHWEKLRSLDPNLAIRLAQIMGS